MSGEMNSAGRHLVAGRANKPFLRGGGMSFPPSGGAGELLVLASGGAMQLKFVGERFVELARSAEFYLFAERRFFQPAEVAFRPGDLPTIESFVGIRGTERKRLFRTVSEFPTIHEQILLSEKMGNTSERS